MNGLYFYKLVSPYPEDVTKNCKLTINEIDSNFLTLKDNDIKKAEFVRDEKTLVLTRYNGEKLIVLLDDVTYNFEASKECGESGTTLVLSYDGKEGKRTLRLENILTMDNLMDVIGSDILTKVITDGTLKGNGTMTNPLGISGVEKTGSLAPVLQVFDLTNGEKLPEVAKLGTRYITKEYVSDYGYLYNGAGVDKITQKLKGEFISENTKEGDERYAWRVPSKKDWDALLNSIEPKLDDCVCRNHDSLDCHVDLGCFAGKFLKSECGCYNQPDCECSSRKPGTGCEGGYSDDIDDGQIIPEYDPSSPIGVDKYGMTILPAGFGAIDDITSSVRYNDFTKKAYFWTTTQVASGQQDTYAKVFSCNKSTVYQVAECPNPYFSVRLVKDYDGSNYKDSEYIDGILYKTILFPEAGQVWLASNYADTEGFIGYDEGGQEAEYLNLGDQLLYDRRVEMFVNEWNGEYWEKRIMKEGETVVVEDPCFGQDSTGETTNVCWMDDEKIPHCVEVEIPKIAQRNIEYRVYTIDDYCNKDLLNTDDLVVERVLHIVVPMIEKERWERIKADEALSGAIDDERAERESADTELWEALSAETEARISADTDLWDAIEAEASARTEADEALSAAIETEREERILADEALSGAIEDEREQRIAGDDALSAAIETEREERIAGDEALWEALSAETEARIEEDEKLWEALSAETEARISADTMLDEKIDAETERAKAREDEIDGQLIDWSKNPFTMSASTGYDEEKEETKPNLVLETKDGDEDHFIKVKFDGNFGEI